MVNYKQEMRDLFEVSIGKIREFRKKSYEQAFQDLYESHQTFFQQLEEGLKEGVSKEEAAGWIPQYAKEKLESLPKRKREVLEVDYNLCMAVYVIPLLKFGDLEEVNLLSNKVVETWNKENTTSLILKASRFEEVLGGFKKGLCYITTAVCQKRNLPDDCQELETLRLYRDTYLKSTREGQNLVQEYYDLAPILIQGMNGSKEEIYDRIYQNTILPCIEKIHSGDMEECKVLYQSMVEEMGHQFGGSLWKGKEDV